MTQVLARESSVTGRYSDMQPSQFTSEFEKTWEALDDVKDVIKNHVEKGNLLPIDAIRGLSSLTANVLGYEEFVPRNNSGVPISSSS